MNTYSRRKVKAQRIEACACGLPRRILLLRNLTILQMIQKPLYRKGSIFLAPQSDTDFSVCGNI